MNEYKSTREVAKILNVNVSRLSRLLWLERIALPQRGPGRAFLWTDEDIQRAAKVLLEQPYPVNGCRILA